MADLMLAQRLGKRIYCDKDVWVDCRLYYRELLPIFSCTESRAGGTVYTSPERVIEFGALVLLWQLWSNHFGHEQFFVVSVTLLRYCLTINNRRLHGHKNGCTGCFDLYPSMGFLSSKCCASSRCEWLPIDKMNLELTVGISLLNFQSRSTLQRSKGWKIALMKMSSKWSPL